MYKFISAPLLLKNPKTSQSLLRQQQFAPVLLYAAAGLLTGDCPLLIFSYFSNPYFCS